MASSKKPSSHDENYLLPKGGKLRAGARPGVMGNIELAWFQLEMQTKLGELVESQVFDGRP